MQLLSDALMREIPPANRKLVLFSDSRQDAAKLSTGIKIAHYLDIARQIATGRLYVQIASSTETYAQATQAHARACELLLLERKQMSENLNPLEQQRRQELIGGLASSMVVEVLQRSAVGQSPTGSACSAWRLRLDSI